MPSAGVKVYVGHLPERARPEDIKECFSKYGNVVNMELKGNYGFIEYEERRICEEAIDSLNGTEFQGSQLRVEFAHGERNGTFKYHNHHHHHHHNNHHHSNNNNRGAETKSTDTCFKCGLVGHWARECTSNGREFVSRKPGRYDDRRTSDSYIREPYSARDNRDKYIRDERYPPPALPERGGYDRPYDRYGRDPPEMEYRRDYRGTYDRPYERERDRPYDRNYPEREYDRIGRDNYDRNYYTTPRDGYDRDGYERRAIPPPDVPLYPGRGRPGSPPPPPRRGSYERGIRDPPISSYRARSPLATSRYPDPLIGPPPLRPSSPRTGIYRRRSMSPIRSGRTNIPYSGRQRSPSPVSRPLSTRRGPSTPTPPPRR